MPDFTGPGGQVLKGDPNAPNEDFDLVQFTKTAAQALASNVSTQVTWTAVTGTFANRAAMLTANAFIAPRNGWYQASASLIVGAATVSTYTAAELRRYTAGGVFVASRVVGLIVDANGFSSPKVDAFFQLLAGEQIRVHTTAEGAAGGNLDGATFFNRMAFEVSR